MTLGARGEGGINRIFMLCNYACRIKIKICTKKLKQIIKEGIDSLENVRGATGVILCFIG